MLFPGRSFIMNTILTDIVKPTDIVEKMKAGKSMDRIKVKQLMPQIYLMDDAGESMGYVVTGEDKALVIDTMNGYDDVKAVVRSLTDLPIMVVNTHGHCDHIFGNIYFEEVYMHPLDMEVARQHMQFDEFLRLKEERGLSAPPIRPIRHGDVIDLGGLTVEVIHFPGHTQGSILLLLREERVLFAGDAINTCLWLQLEESSSVQEYLHMLDGAMYLKERADYILHGHAGQLLPISLMDGLRRGLWELSQGMTEKDTDCTYFGGTARQHPYDEGRAVIVYPK